jgi:hypothetical protein
MSFKPHWLVIHHTQGYSGARVTDVQEALRSRGVKGYHWVQVRSGVWCMAALNRGDKPAEHVGHHNSKAVGYSFIGSFQGNAPDIERLRAAAVDCAVLLRLYGLTPADMIAHRDVPDNDTDCPGKAFTPNIFEAFRTMVAEQYQAGA